MREWLFDDIRKSLDSLGETCKSSSELGYAKLRRLALDRELRVLVCPLLGEVGGSFDSRDGIRLGLMMKDGSPGTASSVSPAREFGARA
jgi:hypothetical protein